MNNAEKMFFLSSKMMMLSFDRGHNKKEIDEISKELAVLQQQLVKDNVATVPPLSKPTNTGFEGFLEFNEKEISKMPQKFRKEFRTEGCSAHVRRRTDGRYKCSYEIRYRRNGYNITASATTMDEAKNKFIIKLKTAKPQEAKQSQEKKLPDTFKEFGAYFFKNIRPRNVAPKTLQADMGRYKLYIEPYFESTPLSKIDSHKCQELINSISASGKGKTCNEIYSLLNVIFKAAIDYDIISRNPMKVVYKDEYESEHGKALSKSEEEYLLSETKGTKYQLIYAIGLYTGLRPNEYYTARIDGDFIIAKNSKRKCKKIIRYKKIPIINKLRGYIAGLKELNLPKDMERARKKIKELLPNHKLYDLRTTFYNRCKECGVSVDARHEFMGHCEGKIDEAYTNLPDDFLLREGSKIDY